MKKEAEYLNYYFRCLVVLATILSLVGLIFIFSASSVYSTEKFGISYYFLKKQFIFLCAGIAGALFCACTPLHWWKRGASFLFFSSLGGVFLTFFSAFSMKVHGSSRWLSIGGFSLQPGEFLKVSLIVYLAVLLERRSRELSSFKGYVPLLGIVCVAVLFLLKQPDFGMAVTIFLTALIMFFSAGVNRTYIAATCAAAIPLGMLVIAFASYRINRILIFLNPWNDPRGKGYQIIQSLIAIGCGGMWGVGISNSRQKFFYLPMQHTDFIFSIIAEETGYSGCCLLIIAYVFFLYWGLRIASALRSSFASCAALGFIVLISLQALINLMVVTGLLPTKGLGLPFISYGGSALICNWCMIGLLANFVRSEKVK